MILFTLAQAQELLPRVREELVAMQACKRELDAVRDELARAVEPASGNGHVKHQDAFAKKRLRAQALVDDINDRLARINGWGVELKGIDEGLVDFPADRAGRVVYLCWKLGEDRIAWWHEVEAGFAGRQPL
ncbi:MAG TPA: DUF2203 domain-containing protein [Dehalococcoidia bacterium]|nr:DUF2203 domain-containing protein [Dehalococcoidia bacterium]